MQPAEEGDDDGGEAVAGRERRRSWPTGPAASKTPASPASAAADSSAEPDGARSRRSRRSAPPRRQPPTMRIWKPIRCAPAEPGASGDRRSASGSADMQPLPSTRIGSIASSANIRVCGKLKPPGRPRAVHQRSPENWIADVARASGCQDLVRVEPGAQQRRDGGPGAAASAPPAASAAASPARLSPKASATPPPAMAPMASCPSAPMFQTLARKPMAMPTATGSSGVAFSPSSVSPSRSTSGDEEQLPGATSGS